MKIQFNLKSMPLPRTYHKPVTHVTTKAFSLNQ